MLDGSSSPLISSPPAVVNGAGARRAMPNTWTRAGIKSLCFAAVAIEPFFSWFLAGATRDGIVQIIKAIITKNPSIGVLNGVETVSYIMAGFNLYCDFLSVSPARDADDLIDGFTTSETEKTRKEAIQKALTIGLMIASIILSFPQGAAADNIPIADWIYKKFGETFFADVFNYSALAVIGLLGTIYYTMFCYGRMKQHMGKAIDIVSNPKDFIKAVFSKENFLGYLEVGMQASANTLYRGVNFGFLVLDEIQHIFRKSNNSSFAKTAAWATIVETGILTLFTRTLSAHKHFLNPNFKYVESEAMNTNGLRLGTISDLILSALRGVGIGVFTYTLFSGFDWGYGLGYPIGLLSGTLSFVERYKVAKYEKAMAKVGNAEIERRKNKKDERLLKEEAINGSVVISVAPKEPSQYEVAKSTYDAIGKALHYPMDSSHIDSVFSPYAAVHYFTLFSNFIARDARVVAFFSFLVTVNTVLELNLSFLQIVMLTLAAGIEVTKNDFSNYKESNDDTIRDYRVSYLLQKERDKESGNTGTFAGFTRVFRTVWNASPGSYTQAELDRGLRIAQQQEEERQSLLPRRSAPTPSLHAGDSL